MSDMIQETRRRFMVNMIVACDEKLGIGVQNRMPWYIYDETRQFRNITTFTHDGIKQNAIIMGRKTWESLQKPLPKRINVVISSNPESVKGDVLSYTSLEVALDSLALNFPNIENIFIIGGRQLYAYALSHPTVVHIEKLYYSVIHGEYMCDVFFPINPITAPDWQVVMCDQTHSDFTSYICKKVVHSYEKASIV